MNVDTHDTPGGALSPEATADLAAIDRMVAGDPNVPPPEDGPVEPIRPPLSAEIAGALLMLSKMAAPAFPSLGAIYTPEACEAVGNAVAPVCEKHGWMQDGLGGEYGEEIMCLCVVGPMAFATYAAVRNDIAAREAESKAKSKSDGRPVKETPPPGALRVPGSDTVTFGAPVHENG